MLPMIYSAWHTWNHNGQTMSLTCCSLTAKRFRQGFTESRKISALKNHGISSHWWFGNSRTLQQNRAKPPLRVQWFLGQRQIFGPNDSYDLPFIQIRYDYPRHEQKTMTGCIFCGYFFSLTVELTWHSPGLRGNHSPGSRFPCEPSSVMRM